MDDLVMHLFRGQTAKHTITTIKNWIGVIVVTSVLFPVTLLGQSSDLGNRSIEYQIKAAFIANFIAFTQWPENITNPITLCLYGEDYFGDHLDQLQNKPKANYQIQIQRINNLNQVDSCQSLFISKSSIDQLEYILDYLENRTVLTIADSPNAAKQGIAINMDINNEKITFEINLRAARNANLNISSKLLQLAISVYQ